ncbi:hypothetical protein WH52_07250 [Tenacibaculum holothuriorum]|uniref:Uncharacterized protein n=1 Tax=Tenacibaculum holothuriorum TaxID=1635173 RepID=A0A1Y2PDH0_9FLAO|nr:hypothetical protein [Tenacibaculum holothuriorum]OSY88536.1 hypothetical protein WH52_07250 [Tenacibaculum holothuriorum]
MKDIVISDTAKGIVSAGKIVNSLEKLDQRIEQSKSQAKNLFKDLDKSSTSIHKTEEKLFGGYKTKDLFNLIRDNHKTDVKTTRIVNNLIRNNNDNIKDISKMIGALAMLSGLSFEKLSENTTELEEISNQLKNGLDHSSDNSKNLKRVIISQIDRVKEEKKKQEKNDYNIGVLNDNFKELQVDFIEYKKNNEKKLKEIRQLYQTSSEDHFIKTLKRQKILIYCLFFLSMVSIITHIMMVAKTL